MTLVLQLRESRLLGRPRILNRNGRSGILHDFLMIRRGGGRCCSSWWIQYKRCELAGGRIWWPGEVEAVDRFVLL